MEMKITVQKVTMLVVIAFMMLSVDAGTFTSPARETTPTQGMLNEPVVSVTGFDYAGMLDYPAWDSLDELTPWSCDSMTLQTVDVEKHHNCMKCTTNEGHATRAFSVAKENGFVEYYCMFDTLATQYHMSLGGLPFSDYTEYLTVKFLPDGSIELPIESKVFKADFQWTTNQWYHVRVEFVLGSDEEWAKKNTLYERGFTAGYNLWIDSELVYFDKALEPLSGNQVNAIQFGITVPEPLVFNGVMYVDAIHAYGEVDDSNEDIENLNEILTEDRVLGSSAGIPDVYHNVKIASVASCTIETGKTIFIDGLVTVLGDETLGGAITVPSGSMLNTRDGLKYNSSDHKEGSAHLVSHVMDTDVKFYGGTFTIDGSVECDGLEIRDGSLNMNAGYLRSTFVSILGLDKEDHVDIEDATITCINSFSMIGSNPGETAILISITDSVLNVPFMWIQGASKDYAEARFTRSTFNGVLDCDCGMKYYIGGCSIIHLYFPAYRLTSLGSMSDNKIVIHSPVLGISPDIGYGMQHYRLRPRANGDPEQAKLDYTTNFKEYFLEWSYDEQTWSHDLDAVIIDPFCDWPSGSTSNVFECVNFLAIKNFLSVSITGCKTARTRILQVCPAPAPVFQIHDSSFTWSFVESTVGYTGTIANCQFFALHDLLPDTEGEWSSKWDWSSNPLGNIGNGFAGYWPGTAGENTVVSHTYINCWFPQNFKACSGFPGGNEYFEGRVTGTYGRYSLFTFIDTNFDPGTMLQLYDTATAKSSALTMEFMGAPADEIAFNARKHYYMSGIPRASYSCHLFVPPNAYRYTSTMLRLELSPTSISISEPGEFDLDLTPLSSAGAVITLRSSDLDVYPEFDIDRELQLSCFESFEQYDSPVLPAGGWWLTYTGTIPVAQIELKDVDPGSTTNNVLSMKKLSDSTIENDHGVARYGVPMPSGSTPSSANMYDVWFDFKLESMPGGWFYVCLLGQDEIDFKSRVIIIYNHVVHGFQTGSASGWSTVTLVSDDGDGTTLSMEVSKWYRVTVRLISSKAVRLFVKDIESGHSYHSAQVHENQLAWEGPLAFYQTNIHRQAGTTMVGTEYLVDNIDLRAVSNPDSSDDFEKHLPGADLSVSFDWTTKYLDCSGQMVPRTRTLKTEINGEKSCWIYDHGTAYLRLVADFYCLSVAAPTEFQYSFDVYRTAGRLYAGLYQESGTAFVFFYVDYLGYIYNYGSSTSTGLRVLGNDWYTIVIALKPLVNQYEISLALRGQTQGTPVTCNFINSWTNNFHRISFATAATSDPNIDHCDAKIDTITRIVS